MRQYNVLKILKEVGLEYKRGGGSNVRIKCVNPDHIDTNPSMYVHKETGIVHCFGCGFKGNIYDLLGAIGISRKEAYFLIRQSQFILSDSDINNDSTFKVRSRMNKLQEEKDKEVSLPEHVPAYDHPYLMQRGITNDDIKKWSISVVTLGMYKDWILFPIYQGGVLRNYFLRQVNGDGKRYASAERRDLLAGIDFVVDFDKKVYVVEGIIDAIIFSHTRNQCVATLSNRLLPEQIRLLRKFKHIVVVPDNDKAGFELIRTALPLVHTSNVSVCFLPKNRKDAADCTLEELLESTYYEKSVLDVLLSFGSKAQ